MDWRSSSIELDLENTVAEYFDPTYLSTTLPLDTLPKSASGTRDRWESRWLATCG